MDSLQFAILVIIHQVSLARGAVTITFDDNGYIGQSIVLQCKTNTTFVAKNGVWFFNGSLISSITTGRYSEIKTLDGFNLTISDLTTAHAGYYRCAIDFGSSSNKTLGILYDTSIEITANPSTLKVTITIIAYPAPEYNVTLTKNGSLVTVLWSSTNITRADGAITITLMNWQALNKTDYQLTVKVTSPVAAFKIYNVTFATSSELPDNKTKCDLELGLGLGHGLGIPIVIIIIVAVIFICTGYKHPDIHGIVLGLGLCIIFIVCCIIIASLISTGNKCKLELGLGLGLSSGTLWLIVCIIAVIFIFSSFSLFKGKVEFGKGLLFICVNVYLKCTKQEDNPQETDGTNDEDNPQETDGKKPEQAQLKPIDTKGKTKNPGSSSAVSRDHVSVQMENKGFKSDEEERPPAVHTRTQNKVEPDTISNQTNDRQQPVPPIRPQPPPPQNGEIKDRNLRGISANLEDTQGLANETPRHNKNKLPPLTAKQETVQEEDVSEEPKKKRKKKKKKDQINEETPDDENGGTIQRVN